MEGIVGIYQESIWRGIADYLHVTQKCYNGRSYI